MDLFKAEELSELYPDLLNDDVNSFSEINYDSEGRKTLDQAVIEGDKEYIYMVRDVADLLDCEIDNVQKKYPEAEGYPQRVTRESL